MTDCFRIRRDFTSMPWKERMRFINALIKVSTQDPYKRSYDQLIATHTNNFKNGIHNLMTSFLAPLGVSEAEWQQVRYFLIWQQERYFLIWQQERYFLIWQQERYFLIWQQERYFLIWQQERYFLIWQQERYFLIWQQERYFLIWQRERYFLIWQQVRYFLIWQQVRYFLIWQQERYFLIWQQERYFLIAVPSIDKYLTVHELNRVPGNDFTKFEMVLRDTLHNNMHCRIGGRGGTMCSTSSANAPEFLLHHGFTDKLWADWQKIGDVNGDRKQRDSFFESKGYRMTAKKYSPRDLLDLSRQPGGVKVMYEDPSHDHYQRVHGYLKTLSLKELKDIPRKRFTESGTLEFKIFMVTSRSEQLSTMAQQSSLEPKRSLRNGDLRTAADRTLGMRIKDIEAAAKRGLELAKKESRADHATV
ncbi:predicted protein [Nematostella vectensis]|uniref:Tyrosinase copper-binding domain-containing protein n=1 Tax=Nematostella vectensis TaxID=45351 RepID=A7RWK6_NEMVE|nr:predicted protein [Nematostella vectensis]|eukprot:XP_001636244.1 predicted protein [Nematostella vectensis]